MPRLGGRRPSELRDRERRERDADRAQHERARLEPQERDTQRGGHEDYERHGPPAGGRVAGRSPEVPCDRARSSQPLAATADAQQQKKNGATNGGAAPLLAEANGDHVQIDYATSFYEAERGRTKRAVERIRGQLRAVDVEVGKLEREIARRFHPYWGSLLKEANETSSFGDQVEEYACIYTSRVSNLLAYSPLQYFRSPRDMMPHEL